MTGQKKKSISSYILINIFIIFFIYIFSLANSKAEIVKKIEINGNKRISEETIKVYGDIEKSLRSDEEFKYKPSSPYSASKASADHFVNSYIRTYGINAVISNCCNNYGPYQYPEKLIPKMISNITVVTILATC